MSDRPTKAKGSSCARRRPTPEEPPTPSLDTTSQRLPVPAQGLSRDELAEQYTPYVRAIAGRIKKTLSQDIDFDDLVSYGVLGLMEAVDRFDAMYGANFTTFAYYRVRGAIYDGLRGMGWVSRTEYQRYRFEQRANAYLNTLHDQNLQAPVGIRKSTDDEINDLAHVVEGLVTIYVTALDAMEGFEVEDDRGPTIEESVELRQARARVRAALDRLGGQEKTLLELYYYGEMSLEEVGKQLGLSKSWTSRLHGRAIQKMGRLLRDLADGNRTERSPSGPTAGKRGPADRKSTQQTDPPNR